MKKYIATALLPLLLALSACGAAESVDHDQTAEQIANVQQFDVDGGGDTFVFKTTIDGTECVIADTYEGVGVSCDWAGSEATTDGFE